MHCGQSLGKSADVFAVMYVSTLLLIRLDLSATLPHTASTGWIEPVFAGLTNHNLCYIFHALTEMFVYKLLLRVSQNSGHYPIIICQLRLLPPCLLFHPELPVWLCPSVKGGPLPYRCPEDCLHDRQGHGKAAANPGSLRIRTTP